MNRPFRFTHVNYSQAGRCAATALALLLVSIAWLAAPAQAGSLSGMFDGTATLTPTGTPGVFIQNFTGDGIDNTYGAFDVTSMSTVDFSAPPNIVFTNGMLTETFTNPANIGTLFGTGSGSGTASGLGTATFTIHFVITGGTGFFAGDHGEATNTGDITQTGPGMEAISNASYTGTLVTPEPSSWMLLGLGITLGKRFLARRKFV